jgi:hypothetical protein
MPSRLLVALTLFGLAVVGCGRPETVQVQLARVRGNVTLDQEPLKKAIVVFECPDGSFSYAETDSSGRFDLRFDSQTHGAKLGAKTVRISMNRRILGLNSNDEGGPSDKAGGAFRKQPPELIPDRYHKESVLKVEVTSGTNRFNFDLTSRPPKE